MMTQEDYINWNINNYPHQIINTKHKKILNKFIYWILLILAFFGIIFILSIILNQYHMEIFKIVVEHKLDNTTLMNIKDTINNITI